MISAGDPVDDSKRLWPQSPFKRSATPMQIDMISLSSFCTVLRDTFNSSAIY
jgi:hypothetical protein